MEQNLEKDINAIKNNLSAFGMKLEMVYAALVGNEIAKDGGLVADIAGQQRQISRLKERIEKVEKNETRKHVYINILWAVAGGVVIFLLTHIFK